jgi:hypothetical protein
VPDEVFGTAWAMVCVNRMRSVEAKRAQLVGAAT